MQIYLINLDRRKDRLEAMQAQAVRLGLRMERVQALDAATADPDSVNRWFAPSGPLGEIPAGDKACLLSHRAAWDRFLAGNEPYAMFLEDDVRLSKVSGTLLMSYGWIPRDIDVVKLEHYGPLGQRVLVADFRKLPGGFGIGRMLSRHTGGAAYVLSRKAAALLLAEKRFYLPVDHLLFNPNNSNLFDQLSPWQLLPAIARQREFVGEKSDIEKTRRSHRRFSINYVVRELVRFGYDLRLLPRQIGAVLNGAKFVAVRTAD